MPPGLGLNRRSKNFIALISYFDRSQFMRPGYCRYTRMAGVVSQRSFRYLKKQTAEPLPVLVNSSYIIQ